MSIDQLRLVLGIAVAANVVLLVALALPVLLGRRPARPERADQVDPPEPADIALEVAVAQGDLPAELTMRPFNVAYDRAVRVVSYGFLLAVAAAVALSNAWAATAPAIYILLGASGLAMLLVHDVLPARLLGASKFVLEGVGAIVVVTLLVALTGGASSPFVLGYFLIAAGGALVVDSRTNLLLAGAVSIVYLVTVALLPGNGLSPSEAAQLGIVLLAFWLFSYLASVVARAQRATRDVALRLSLHDPLTRLYNRSYFHAIMEREVQRARRTGRPFCLVLLDLDNLKPINDTFGHPMGDRLLHAVADVVRGRIRAIDTAARYGGDEFVVLLPETDLAGGVILAEKLREGAAEIRLTTQPWVVRTSISIGVAMFPDDGTSAQALLDRADYAMYGSKRHGRDRVGIARPAGARVETPARVEAPAAMPQPMAHAPAVIAAATAPRPAPSPAPSGAQSSGTPVPGLRNARGWAPVFGGTRADSVLAALVSASARPAATSREAGTRAAAAASSPAISGPPRRNGYPIAGGALAARVTETPVAATSGRPKRERRFPMIHQEDPHFSRTMRQFFPEGDPMHPEVHDASRSDEIGGRPAEDGAPGPAV